MLSAPLCTSTPLTLQLRLPGSPPILLRLCRWGPLQGSRARQPSAPSAQLWTACR